MAVIVCCVGGVSLTAASKPNPCGEVILDVPIGTSGVAKSVLIKLLCLTPLNFGVVPAVK